MRGTITKIVSEKGYGFIRPSDGSGDVFFHRTALRDLSFNELLQERQVVFELNGDERPRAASVEAV